MNPELPLQILEKYLNKYLRKFVPVGVELFHADAETDRHDVANSRFTQFCKRALKFSPYCTENTLPHHYKHHVTNADQRNNGY